MGLGLGLWEVGGDEPKASPGALHNQMTIDADLWALVGSQPVTPVEEDKALIREEIGRRLSA